MRKSRSRLETRSVCGCPALQKSQLITRAPNTALPAVALSSSIPTAPRHSHIRDPARNRYILDIKRLFPHSTTTIRYSVANSTNEYLETKYNQMLIECAILYFLYLTTKCYIEKSFRSHILPMPRDIRWYPLDFCVFYGSSKPTISFH